MTATFSDFMRRSKLHTVCVAALMFSAATHAQVFTGLSIPAGQSSSRATALSADGTTVVGWSLFQPWRWTANSGLTDLGPAPAGFVLNQATSVSGDGSVVAGYMNDGITSFAFRWTDTTGIRRVNGIGGGSSFGPQISSDGSTIVGRAEGISTGPAARWTATTGAVAIGPITGLPLGNAGTISAYAVSADGSVVVGVGLALSSPFPNQIETFTPFRWTQSAGAVGLLNNGQFYGAPNGAGASDVSADGSVVVGYRASSMWRWTATSGFQQTGFTTVSSGQTPRVSGDGQTMILDNAFWNQSRGTLSLSTVLTQAGCNFTGWTDLVATDVSFNGQTLCGYGTNPQGQTEAWYATIPSPGVLGVASLSGLMTMSRRRRTTR